MEGNGVGCERGPFPSVFKEGWLRLNKKIPFLRGADGVVSNKVAQPPYEYPRSAPYFCWNLLTTPSAPLRTGSFYLMEQPPLKTEGTGPVSQLTPFPSLELRVPSDEN